MGILKKILIINSFYFPTIVGGAEISTQLLAEGLTSDYEVHVLTTGTQKKNIEISVINNVKVHRIQNFNIYSPLDREEKGSIRKLTWHLINIYQPFQAKLLKKLIKEINPDIIHSQNLMGIGTYVWDIANHLSIPVVHTTRDYALVEPVNSTIINSLIHRINIKRSNKVKQVVGISKYILNYHLEKSLFSNAQKNIIGNVVNANRFERKRRQDKEPLTIGYFGQVSSNKGILTLVEALQDISGMIVERLVICGVGDVSEQIKRFSKNDKRIILKGKIPQLEVYRQMANVDVTVVPSKWAEPFGRVIIESYQQGTPVIGTAVGGIPELIENEELLVETENKVMLQNKLKWLQALSIKEFQQLVDESYENSKRFRDNIPEYKQVYNDIFEENNGD